MERFGSHRIHPDMVITSSKQEIMKDQTLVDWFVVSGGIHFEPDSKDEMKTEERGVEG